MNDEDHKPTRAEQRAERVRNNRKMGMDNRSAKLVIVRPPAKKRKKVRK